MIPMSKLLSQRPEKYAFQSVLLLFLSIINTKTLQFNKYCKGLPVKASKQQKSFWG